MRKAIIVSGSLSLRKKPSGKKAIVVSGSVCAGKTTFSKKLARKIKAEYVSLNTIIVKNKLYDGYDRKRKSWIVDVNKLNRFLIKIIKESKRKLVLDGHLSHYLPKKYVEKCYILKCNLKTLEKRLRKRGYNRAKIRENLDVEIFDVCLIDAKERGHKIEIIES